MAVYYNEIDPFCAQWLRNLMADGLIPAGTVDERSIRDVPAHDLADYDQCHFFAGMGGWPFALRLAGVPDDLPLWTGSCPCQPFSAAGRGGGFDDERHLWPAWFDLIRELHPPIILGEQVARAKLWLDLVSADLERIGYAFGAAVLPAASVGAPHLRERLWFVANLQGERRDARRSSQARGRPTLESAGYGDGHRLADTDREPRRLPEFARRPSAEIAGSGEIGDMAGTDGRNASAERQQRGWQQRQLAQDSGPMPMADTGGERAGRNAGGGAAAQAQGDSRRRADGGHVGNPPVACGAARVMADRISAGLEVERVEPARRQCAPAERGSAVGELADPAQRDQWGYPGIARGETVARQSQAWSSDGNAIRGPSAVGFWDDCDWLPCTDGKSRPVEPGTFPLAHGVPARVHKLRALGNAIVPPLAAEFIIAAMEAMDSH